MLGRVAGVHYLWWRCLGNQVNGPREDLRREFINERGGICKIHTQHSLTGNNHLLWLFFNWQRPYQRSYFLSSFPFGKLSKSLLASPNTCVDDLQEQLTRSRIKDEDSAIYKELVTRIIRVIDWTHWWVWSSSYPRTSYDYKIKN